MFSPAIHAAIGARLAVAASTGISEDFSDCSDWTNITQTLTCGGAAHGTADTKTVARHNTAVGSLDHWVAGTIYYDSGSDGSGLILGSNGTDYYYVSIAGGVLYIRDDAIDYEAYDAGGHAQGSYTVAVQIGTAGGHATFAAWLNGSSVSLTGSTDTNDRVTRGQYVGVWIQRSANNYDSTVDNLTAGSGAYST